MSEAVATQAVRSGAGPVERALHDLIAAESRRASAADAIDHLEHAAETTAAAAFDHGSTDALDDAHRSLHRMFGLALWGSQRLTPPAAKAVEQARHALEHGFRSDLSRRRNFGDAQRPAAGGGLAEWFIATLEALPPVPGWRDFIRERATLAELKAMVAHRSLFFLREPDPWVFAIPALRGEAKAGLIDLLLDEYGWGKYERMHSTVYEGLMRELGLKTELDAYFDETPWQYIATLNLQWMYGLTPGYRDRLIGAIYLTEAESPDAMENYLAAWERLGVDSSAVTNFYELHVTADEDHRRVALEEVVVPTCQARPNAIGEIAAGMIDLHLLENDYLATFIERPLQDASTREISTAA